MKSKTRMRPARVVEIETPKKYVLDGIWWGPKKPKQTIVWIHGLTGSAFSMRNLIDAVTDPQTAVLTFNNRGFGKINSVKRRAGKKIKSLTIGAAHEIFTECRDDIQGAVNFVRRAGIKRIFLAGHSTGCQKAVYWASRRDGGRGVAGIVLLGPVCDRAAAVKDDKNGTLAKALRYARKLVRAGKKHELLPSRLRTRWSFDDAQRFISLYAPDSREAIFPYEQKNKIPTALRSVAKPVLVLWAEKDEYADRPAREVAAWFDANIRAPHRVVIVRRVGHGFKGGEKIAACAIRKFMKESQAACVINAKAGYQDERVMQN